MNNEMQQRKATWSYFIKSRFFVRLPLVTTAKPFFRNFGCVILYCNLFCILCTTTFLFWSWGKWPIDYFVQSMNNEFENNGNKATKKGKRLVLLYMRSMRSNYVTKWRKYMSVTKYHYNKDNWLQNTEHILVQVWMFSISVTTKCG